ncbi:MAG: PIN domain-containing protein [Nanoarchaeota archaeon]
MTDTKLLDSSIWIDYFHNSKHSDLINSDEILFLSALSLFEIKKKIYAKDPEKTNIAINKVKERSIIIPVDSKIAEKAVEFSVKNKMHMADSIIYASAILNNYIVITLDNHFDGLDKAIVVKD